jgi:hypothetical protein
MEQTHPKLPLSFNYSSSFRWHKDADPLTFRELGELGYKFIFITLYGAHASMFAVWNAMQELVKNEEQGQWTLERTKVGHPTESHHVMARVAHFQEFERKYIPGTEERLKGLQASGTPRATESMAAGDRRPAAGTVRPWPLLPRRAWTMRQPMSARALTSATARITPSTWPTNFCNRSTYRPKTSSRWRGRADHPSERRPGPQRWLRRIA